MAQKISITQESLHFLEKLLKNPDKYHIQVSKDNSATILDCGINTEGSLAAGLLFVKITLGGLADVSLTNYCNDAGNETLAIQVQTSYPVLATLGCQAASWNISIGNFFGMACGPGRALAQKPSKIYRLLNYEDKGDKAILCIESDKIPDDEAITYIAEKCGVSKNNLFLLMIRTNCLIEYIQMAARAIELGIFRLVEQLNYPKEQILHAIGLGVISPLSEDLNESNDRVNNGLIYGTKLYLIVRSVEGDQLAEKAKQMISKASKNYGRKFLEVFAETGNDFGNFDLSLLAPSEVIINDLTTGKIYQEGKINLKYILE